MPGRPVRYAAGRGGAPAGHAQGASAGATQRQLTFGRRSVKISTSIFMTGFYLTGLVPESYGRFHPVSSICDLRQAGNPFWLVINSLLFDAGAEAFARHPVGSAARRLSFLQRRRGQATTAGPFSPRIILGCCRSSLVALVQMPPAEGPARRWKSSEGDTKALGAFYHQEIDGPRVQGSFVQRRGTPGRACRAAMATITFFFFFFERSHPPSHDGAPERRRRGSPPVPDGPARSEREVSTGRGPASDRFAWRAVRTLARTKRFLR